MPQSTESTVALYTAEQIMGSINGFLAYIQEPGIQLQLLEQIAKALPLPSDETPYKLLTMAVTDIFGTSSLEGDDGDAWMTVDFLEVVDAAPSLEFLVRHARSIDATVLPREVIPSDTIVAACLVVFHGNMPEVEEVLKKPAEWLAELRPGTKIIDPDGWRVDGKPFDEPITLEEFEQRFGACTISPPVDIEAHAARDPDPGNY